MISSGGSSTGSRGIRPHTGVHSEMVSDHTGTGGMPPHLLTMYRGRSEAGDDPDDEMVVSVHGK